MGGIECIGKLDRNGKQSFQLQWSARNQVLQRHTVKVFHDNERLPILLINFMDGTNVGMIQGRRGLGFALKTPSRDWGSLATSSGKNFRATNRPNLTSSAL